MSKTTAVILMLKVGYALLYGARKYVYLALVCNIEMMRLLPRAIVVATLLAVSCSDEPESVCPPRDYATCGAPLDPTKTRVTYSEALAGLSSAETCTYSATFRGSCADGKQFLSQQFGLGSNTSYFVGEQLVGGVSSNDVVDCSTPCPVTGFSGTLTTVRCDSPKWELLCQPEGTKNWSPGLPFANGLPGPTCEELCDTGTF
jgi:hypothetical protein